MKLAWASLGLFLISLGSCYDNGDHALATGGAEGRSGGASGQQGSAGEGGAAASGGTAAGSGGDGGAAECSCDVTETPEGGRASCEAPLAAVCCENIPSLCSATLEEVLSNLSELCRNDAQGTMSDCADGYTVLSWDISEFESQQEMIFDPSGRVVGKKYEGAACGSVYTGACGGDEAVDFTSYDAGDLRDHSCRTTCELCPGYNGAGGAPPVCGEGGQGG